MAAEERARRPATMKDVAAAADVGLGTVSRVFSNNGKVAAGTRRRVEEVASRLNYRPSALGRGLKASTGSNIGLLVTDISNSFYGEFAEGLLGAASSLGRHVILCATGEDPVAEREYVDLLLQERVGGIVAFPTGENQDLWRSAQDLGARLLFVDRAVEGIDAAALSVDHLTGARLGTEHLLALGHRRIGYLGGPDRLTSGSMREAGYRRAHADVGVPVDDRLVVRTRFTLETAYASAVRLLDAPDPPTALFAGNNVLGEAALTAMRDRGLSLPGDLSLVMFDDVSWARLVDPPVTVIAQPTRQLGAMAARTVLTAEQGSRELLLAPELVVRRSTAPFYG